MTRSMPLSQRLRSCAKGAATALALGGAVMLNAPAQAAPAGCQGDSGGNSWVFLEANGLKNSKGWLTVKIYNDADEFLGKGGSMDVVRVPAQQGTQRVCVKLPENGNYAFFVYHDEDRNKKLNFKLLPPSISEGGGFSNNPKMGTLRRPSWAESAVRIARPGLAIRVNIEYP